MSKACPKGHNIGGERFCPQCGTAQVDLPRCNWCDEQISPRMRYCTGCGKTRYEAIATFPPPGKIKQFFAKLFGKLIQKTAE